MLIKKITTTETQFKLQNRQTAHTAQYQKQSNPEMGKRSKQTILQRTHTNGQKAHEKMPNITNY